MKSPMEIKITDEFTSAMQQLSAEAEKTLPENGRDGGNDKKFGEILDEVRVLNGRMASFEQKVLGRLEKLESAEKTDFAEQFRRMDEHLAALRNTETVNQRLFDSLHDEMIKYRDNFLHESLQKPFIRDLVTLFDDLSAILTQVQTAVDAGDGKRGALGQWRDNLENAIHSLTEILHRMEVSEIEPKEVVDRALHRVINFEPADFAEEDGQIIMRVKRGFLWRDQVLRPEEVVAKRFG
jgi:molecular chaperone GrpE (heat shock protein)